MSYILDALKKSEQERKQGEVPDLNSLRDPTPARSNRKVRILVIGSVLLLILAINLWVILRQTSPPADPIAAATSPEEIAGEEVGDAAETGIGGQAVPPKQPEKIRLIAKTLPMNAPKVPEIAEPTIAAGSDDLDQNDAAPTSEDDFDREFSEQPFDDFREDDARPTVSHADLPANIRNSLPDLSIAAHYYSQTPSARMASINGRIMRESDTIAQGLTLEEITEEGVVFSFDKYRFSLKVFNR